MVELVYKFDEKSYYECLKRSVHLITWNPTSKKHGEEVVITNIYIYIWTPQPITFSRCACGGNNDFRLGRDVVGRKGNIVNQPCYKKVMDFFCIDDVILHTKIELVTNTDITETDILSCLPLPKLSFA